MSRTMLAAHAGVAENDEHDCHMEEYCKPSPLAGGFSGLCSSFRKSGLAQP